MSFTNPDYERSLLDQSGSLAPNTEDQPNIDQMLGDLSRIEQGADVAYNLSSFLHALQVNAAKRNSKISNKQRDELLLALSAATRNSLGLFYDQYGISFAGNAINRAKSIISKWANFSTHTERHYTDSDADDDAYVRCLRNACHNLSLIKEIENRTAHRRSKTINNLLAHEYGATTETPL